jgi:hypothetical protein
MLAPGPQARSVAPVQPEAEQRRHRIRHPKRERRNPKTRREECCQPFHVGIGWGLAGPDGAVAPTDEGRVEIVLQRPELIMNLMHFWGT